MSPPSFTLKTDANTKLTWAEEAMSEGDAVALGRQHSTARRPGPGVGRPVVRASTDSRCDAQCVLPTLRTRRAASRSSPTATRAGAG